MSQSAMTQANARCCILVGGSFYTNYLSVPSVPLELQVGSARVPLVEIADVGRTVGSRVSLDTQFLSQSVTVTPNDGANGDAVDVKVNKLPNWALRGSQTIQIMLTNREQPCRVSIDRPFVVDVDGKRLRLNAMIATHRAVARLHAQVQNVETGLVTMHPVEFEADALGGREAEGYQKVSFPLPTKGGLHDVRLSIEYQGYATDGTQSEPFIFLADVHVSDGVAGQSDELPTPLVLSGKDVPMDGIWLAARLPTEVNPDGIISIRDRGKNYDYVLPSRPDIAVDDSFGHTLRVSAQTTTELTLFVDGTFDRRFNIDTGENFLRLSGEHLDGATHHLCLRDGSGTIRLWETVVLLPSILTPADVLQRETSAPFPDTIFPQTSYRYRALKTLLAGAHSKAEVAQLVHAIETLEGGHEQVKLEPLTFPKVAKPDVTIVIPAHNQINVTYAALCSLLAAPNTATFEVIVVDDASTDETATLENIVAGVKVVRNAQAQRFVKVCNAGAAQARGEYIALLNNDVEVTAGWLDELIAAFDRFDGVGLVGSKLLYPDGKLQDAGGIVWGSGNPWNYGKHQNANDPRFCYARQADYLSGAALMLPKQVWKEVGGLSAYLEPMYFEDTDLAFKVRDAGYSTWFVPSSVVYHYEGMTAGTDTSIGFKKYQEVNRPKFKRQWAKAYAGFGREGQTPDLEKDRGIVGRVLLIDYTTPRPDRDAGSYAALQEIRLLQSLGYKVTFLPTNMAHLGRYTKELQNMGVEMIYAPFYLTPAEYLGRHAKDFDAFYVTRFNVARDVLPHIKEFAPNAKVLFNNADLHFLRQIRAARASGDVQGLELARQTRVDEIEVISQVDVVMSYNELEHVVIEACTEGAANVRRAPWVVEVPKAVPPLSGREGLSFLGNYRHHPNQEGVEWFVREVMPHFGEEPALSLSIYGSGMPEAIKGLASGQIKPIGFVEEIADAFDTHRIFIAPLMSGAGIKGKVLEALARGVPCVLSPIAAEGIGLRDEQECLIARTPQDWIEAIERLAGDDVLWQEMSDGARRYLAQHYSFERGRRLMREALEAVDLFGSRDG